jgi:hypothetical protein
MTKRKVYVSNIIRKLIQKTGEVLQKKKVMFHVNAIKNEEN